MNESTITDYYNDYCYNNYYEKTTDWDVYYENLAEEEDRNYRDIF